MMTGGSRKHAELILNLAMVLRTALNTDEHGVFQRPEMVESAASRLPLSGFDFTLKLADLYHGIA
ncbi:hypothetical protein [Fulvimarina sp. MAC3]|uniref:hypothetical protein n=1 Tax=Fulvimarina sp. MAC3 TaxID=3148887 RepID=UPI0031FE0B28